MKIGSLVNGKATKSRLWRLWGNYPLKRKDLRSARVSRSQVFLNIHFSVDV